MARQHIPEATTVFPELYFVYLSCLPDLEYGRPPPGLAVNFSSLPTFDSQLRELTAKSGRFPDLVGF